MEQSKVEFIGIGNAIVDIQVKVNDQELQNASIEKGIMNLVDFDEYTRLEKFFHKNEIQMCGGGSVANTTYALQKLGIRSGFVGQLGNDPQGVHYGEEFKKLGIEMYVKPIEARSGACLVFVTPDAQRSMQTYLGASIELSKTHALPPSPKFLLVEGYLFDCPNALKLVRSLAEEFKKQGTKIILSCSDPFCVDRHKEVFIEFSKTYCDLLICNEQEAEHLFSSSDPHHLTKVANDLAETVIVTMHSKGAQCFHGRERFHEPAMNVDALDTTGAGDYFAAGFIWGLLNQSSISDCLKNGNRAASQVVSVYGTRVPNLKVN